MNMSPGEPDVAQIANPYVDYETLADAAKAAGFDLTVPETVDGYSYAVIARAPISAEDMIALIAVIA